MSKKLDEIIHGTWDWDGDRGYLGTGIEKLEDYARSLEAQNEELKAMLRKHEWDGFDFGDDEMCPDCCPECESARTNGHSPDCALAKLIGEE